MILANRLMGFDTKPNKFLFATVIDGTQRKLCCFDVSSPERMRVMSEYITNDIVANEYIYGMDIDQETEILYGFTFSGTGSGSIHAIDISDKNNITRLGRIAFPPNINGAQAAIDTINKILYTATQASNPDLFSVDVSNPSNMMIIDDWTAVSGTLSYGIALDESRGRLYAGGMGPSSFDYEGAFSFGVSSIGTITALDTYTNTTTLESARGCALDKTNEVFYVVGRGNVAGRGYIASFDVSNPSNISLLQIKNLENIVGAWTCEYSSIHNVVFVSSNTADTITAIDVSNPSNMVEIGHLGGFAFPTRIKLSSDGGTLFFGDFNTQIIYALDVSTPSLMTVIGSLYVEGLSPSDISYIEYEV